MLQSATGFVTINADDGNIAGLGNLTLQSGAQNGGGALTLDSLFGSVDFGAGTTLLGGTLANRADIMIASEPTLMLGNVTGLALHSIGNPTNLTATGAITLGTVDVTNSLNVDSANGPIATGDLTSGSGGISLQTAGTGGDISVGVLDAGSGVQILASGAVTVPKAVTARNGNYFVEGSAVTLGTAVPPPTTVLQSATGFVQIIADNGNIAGLGNLTLQSGAQGGGGGPDARCAR